MSQGTFKDTFRAVSEYFQKPLSHTQTQAQSTKKDISSTATTSTTAAATTPTVTGQSSAPLPQPNFPADLHLKLDAFLARYGYDDNNESDENLVSGSSSYGSSSKKPTERDSQRVQEKLRSIYSQYVIESHTAKTSATTALETERQQAEQQQRHASFLRLVRLLRPMIVSKAHLLEWWNALIVPVIEGVGSVGSTRVMLKEARDCASSFMLPQDTSGRGGSRLSGEHMGGTKGKEETELGVARSFVIRAIDAYLVRARARMVGETGLTTVHEYVASEWRALIMELGRAKLKFFLEVIDKYILEADTRYEILRLLSTFLEQEVPHLHVVQDTPIIQDLLRCLLIDGDTAVVSSALTVLMMFLPHVPSAVAAFLPRLFLVYSRVLCWDSSSSKASSSVEGDSMEVVGQHLSDMSKSNIDRNPQLLIDASWKRSQQQDVEMKVELASASPLPSPDATPYFTLLYGLYPLNFTSFINRPRRYLKAANYPEIDHIDFDKPIMRARSDILRQAHLLHPNFLRLSAEQELAENRWMKMEAAEVLLECLQLSTFFVNHPASDSSRSRHWSSASSSSRDSDGISSFKSSRTNLNAQTSTEAEENNSQDDERKETHPVAEEEAGAISSAASLGRILRSSGISPSPHNTLSTQRSSRTPSSDRHSQTLEVNRAAADSNLHGSYAAAAAAATTSLQRQRLDSPIVLPTVGCSRQTNQRSVSGPATSAKNDDKEKFNRRSSAVLDTKSSSNSDSLEKRLLSHQIEINCLRQEVAFLRNDVSFERYLKQQHSVYISQLRKKKLEELRLEAETQNLIIENKSLKSRLAKENENLAQLKRETATSRQQSKKYEEALTLKFRNLHKDHKELNKIHAETSRELKDMKSKQESLIEMLNDSRLCERKTFERLTFYQSELAGRKSLLEELSQMHEQATKYEDVEVRNRILEFQLDSAQKELHNAKRLITSHEVEFDHLQKTFRAKVKELTVELADVRAKATQEAQKDLKSALVAERDKLSTMRTETERLRKKCQNLSFRLYAIEAEKKADAGIAAARERQQAGGSGEKLDEETNAEEKEEPG